jgi:hypothetical protein
MFSMWEKVSGAIMDGPTLGSTATVASGKSAPVYPGRKKPPGCSGRLMDNRGCVALR